MKATGIVRRIDDLGRVVIPKEIRRTMRIREGDPLEIYTDKEGGVIFKKYSQMSDLSDFAGQICETLSKTTGFAAVMTDRDSIIAVSGIPKKELLDRHVSQELADIMEQRSIYQYKDGMVKNPVCEDHEQYLAAVAAPIVTQGDVMGCVVLASEGATATGETEYKLMQTVSGFLGRHMET